MLNRVFGPFDTQGFQISRAQVYSFPLDLTGDDGTFAALRNSLGVVAFAQYFTIFGT